MRFLTLDETGDADAARVGGKAWNCARLKQHGFPVPDGLVIPADVTAAGAASADRDPWFDRWAPDERYAVRSSGLDEDAPEQSFAGVHETRLNVMRREVRDAVAACRASGDSERAQAYRRARALPAATAPPGVLIQRMIQPIVAGVAFTIDPVSGAADEIVVNAAAGLGVAVVDGAVEADEIRVRRRDNAIVSTPVKDRDPTVRLTTAQIQELAALLVAIERLFGAPQDVEWCFDGTRFWIVQSRPITVRPPFTDGRPRRGGGGAKADLSRRSAGGAKADIEWTRANLAEVLPEITSPQALAAVEAMLNLTERREMGRLLAPDDVLGPMVKSFYGRLYFNVSQMRHICLVTGTPPAAVMRSMGHSGTISPEDEQAPRPPLLEWLACLPVFVRLGSRHIRVRRIVRAHEARIAGRITALCAIDPATLPDDQVWATIMEWQRASPDALGVVLLLGGVLVHEQMLRKLCERVDFPLERLLHAHLATGERSVSAQQAVDLVALAGVARIEPRAAAWLARENGSLASMRAALEGTAFMAAFDRFLDQYGHRGIHETDWALPRYAEDPTPLLQAIRLHLRDAGGEDRFAADARAAADAAAAWADFERRFTGWRRWVQVPRARRLLATIKHYYIWREKCRSDMIRVMAVLRQWHLLLARRFVERGWIERPDDYFLVRLEEIARVIEDPSRSAGLRGIVAARSAELERHRRIQMPLLMHESELARLIRDGGRTDRDAGDGDLRGTPVSRGSVEGEVVVILHPGDFSQMKRGAILVARATDPSWTPLFTLAAGVIVEVGGVLSHASTIAREYGIPALANVRHATKRLHTGDRVLLNATEGFVRRSPW